MATQRLAVPGLTRLDLGSVAARLRLWASLHRERRALNRLDAEARRDLGLTEGAAAREAMRPFWDVPTPR